MEIVLLWCFVFAYFAKRGAEDLVHAVKGTPNPRYELKKQRATAAGRPSPRQPRYGGRDWFADLYSDALAAHTEKRRAAAKARPVDDMVDVVREPRRHRHDPNDTRNCPVCKGEVVVAGRPCPRCLAEQRRRNAEWAARHETPEPPVPPPPPEPEPDSRPLAPVINLFPNPQHVEEEITMANSEVTGLSTAIAYADAVANAHHSFTSSGAEGYVGALEQGGNAGEVIASAREAMEASSVAAEKWAVHRGKLQDQLNLKEAYQSQPDAGRKEFLLAE